MKTGMDAPIKVLFVDDEPLILSSIERLMRRECVQVFLANDVLAALQVLSLEDIDIIVSDYDMPLFDGLQLLELLHRERCEIVRIMMTGRISMGAWQRGVDNGSVQRLIDKPWRIETLKQVVQEAADAVRARRRAAPGPSFATRFRRPLSMA